MARPTGTRRPRAERGPDAQPATPEQLRQLQSTMGNAAVARAIAAMPKLQGRGAVPGAVLARNMGIELESHAFKVDTAVKEKRKLKPSERLPEKGAPIAHGRDFQLQSEWVGEDARGLEFVTNPPGLPTLVDWRRHAHGIADMATAIEQRAGKTFNAAQLTGGDPRFEIRGDSALKAHVQVTIGVPLAGIPMLLQQLSGRAETSKIKVGGDQPMRQAVNKTESIKPGLQGKLNLTEPPSGELLGLVALIEYYLDSGGGTGSLTFPKAAVSIMSRTSFTTAFNMLPDPEQKAIKRSMGEWIKALDPNQKTPGSGPVFGKTFHDPQSSTPPLRIDTTIGEWLTEMPKSDLMSGGGAKQQITGGKTAMRFVPGGETFASFLASGKSASLLEDETVRQFIDQTTITLETAEEVRTKKVDKLRVSEEVKKRLRGQLVYFVQGASSRLVSLPENDFKANDFSGENGLDPEKLKEEHQLAKDLYQGLGGLGTTVDQVVWQDDDKTVKQDAMIVELRSVSGLESVEGYVGWMEEVYGVADEAIKAAKPSGLGENATYRNNLAPGKTELLNEASRLRWGFGELANQVQNKKLSIKKAQERANQL